MPYKSSTPRLSAMQLLEKSSLFTIIPRDGNAPQPLAKHNFTIGTIPQREQLFLGKSVLYGYYTA